MTRHPAAISWDPAEAALEWAESATCPLHHLYSTSSWTLNQTWVLQSDRPEVYKKNGLGYHTFPRNLVTNVNSTDCFGKWRFLRTETPGFWCLRSPALVKHGLCLPPWLWFVWVSILEVQQNRKRGKVCCLTWNKSKKMFKKITQIVILIEQLKIIFKMLIEKSFFRL